MLVLVAAAIEPDEPEALYNMARLQADASFESLRGRPEFQNLVTRMSNR